MTLNEVGLKLRRAWPELNEVQLTHSELAQFILNKYPKLYDLISPTARKVKELSDRPVYYESRRWFEGSEQTGLNEAQAIQNRRSTVAMLHEAELVIQASGMKVPVTALHDIAVETHKHNLKMTEYKETAHIDLDAADRKDLAVHYQLEYLHRQLDRLYDEEMALEGLTDSASTKKLARVRRRIKMLEDDFDGREQTLVQNPDGDGLSDGGEETDSVGSSPTEAEGTMEPLPPERPRMGF